MFNYNVTTQPISNDMSVNNVSTDYGDEIYAEPSLEYIDIVVVAMPALAVVGNGVAVVVLMICKRIPFQIKYIFINLISSDALCVSRVPSCHLHVFLFYFPPSFVQHTCILQKAQIT